MGLRGVWVLSLALPLSAGCSGDRSLGGGSASEASGATGDATGDSSTDAGTTPGPITSTSTTSDSATDNTGTTSSGSTDSQTTGESESETSGDGDGDGDGCIPLEAYDWLPAGNAANPSVIAGSVSPNLGLDTSDTIQLELYYGFEPDLDTDIDLGSGDNANYATCVDCLRVFEDYDGVNWQDSRIYYQQSGTLRYTEYAGAGQWSGSLTDVVLVEVTIDQSFESTIVPGGRCLTLTTEFDTVGDGPAPLIER